MIDIRRANRLVTCGWSIEARGAEAVGHGFCADDSIWLSNDFVDLS